ncbi:hypothetical protein O7634_03335 [Micromonospora sp. WMMD1120]|uniref:hypothetical protein n=1 Tax=Micromonospora sp. WMMD1120 TaxID=3016106 RepID=UPI002417CAC7|nr:hypothetical protein [Micromonospora sp. WMMD1120]MDG4805787.1 hypothetical protein [Micromonospora sp. WMMD1120]
MTKKITVSLPDDLAERLAQEPNASAYVAESLRRRVAGERTREILRGAGFALTDEGLARAQVEMDQLEASITPELRTEAARLQNEVLAARDKFHAARAKARR